MTDPVQKLDPLPVQPSGFFRRLWEIFSGTFRKFIWKDLTDGMIDLKALPQAERGTVRLGFLLLATLVLLILFNAYLRTQVALIPMLNSSSYAPGRGIALPTMLAPLTQVFLTIAWSYALAGALHSHLAIRLGILFLYLLSAVRQLVWLAVLAFSMQIGSLDFVILAGALLVVLAVPLLFLLCAFLRPRPALEFLLLLFFVALAAFLPLIRGEMWYRQTGEPLSLTYLQLSITSFAMLAIPFVLLIGFDIADFTQKAAGWVAEIASGFLPRWGSAAALFLLLGWRLFSSTSEEMGRLAVNGWRNELQEYLGALGVLFLVGAGWWLISRLARPKLAGELSHEVLTDSAEKNAFVVIMLFMLPLLVNYLLSSVVYLLPFAFMQALAVNVSAFLNSMGIIWQIIVSLIIFISALGFARRGKQALALYLGLFSLLSLYRDLTRPGYPLAALDWRGTLPDNFWWLILLTLVSIYLLVKKRLTTQNAGELLFLAFVVFLLRQQEFIESPFSPIFGFAGVGFIAFGVIWDALTNGGWTNKDTPGLSRTSRIYLYLGYVILTVTIINWMLVSHDLFWFDHLTGKGALAGFQRFGLPMIYAVFMLTLSRLLRPAHLPPKLPDG